MKKIGIVGGVGWLSTVDYYSAICRQSEQWHLAADPGAMPSMPEISIESLDLKTAVSYLGIDGDEESWSRFDRYHRAALQKLEVGGSDFAIIASNTPHHRYETIVRAVAIPVISILDVVAEETARMGASQVLILGTGLTMSSRIFREGFAKRGVEAVGPADDATRCLTSALIAELQLGKLEGAAERLGTIAKTSFQRQFAGRPVVCLACTELPLAFQCVQPLASFEVDGVVYINTTVIHAKAAFDFAVGELL